MSNQLFVVERYDDTGSPGRLQPLPPSPEGVLVVCAVRVPADDAVLALVEGTADGADQESVSAALAAAGWRVDRINAASWIRPNEEGSR